MSFFRELCEYNFKLLFDGRFDQFEQLFRRILKVRIDGQSVVAGRICQSAQNCRLLPEIPG